MRYEEEAESLSGFESICLLLYDLSKPLSHRVVKSNNTCDVLRRGGSHYLLTSRPLELSNDTTSLEAGEK